jgi:hypothetical protein
MSGDEGNSTSPTSRSPRWPLALGVVGLIGLALFAAAPSAAHIDPPAKRDHNLLMLVPPGPLRLECWQYGTKIIDERPLDDLRLSAIGVSQWLRFRRGGGEVVVTSNGEISCLVTQDRIGP